MKLLREEMDKRWSLANEFGLNKEFLKEIWCFYSLYDLCLAICGKVDSNYKKKNILVQRFLTTQSVSTYNKIKAFMASDVNIINRAMDIVEEVNEGGVQSGDYKKPFMFAISVNE